MWWTYQCGRTEFIEILKLRLSTSRAPKPTALEFQNFINFKQCNPEPYYKLKPSRRHLCGWISPAGRSLPVRWVWEWTALFFWLSVLSAALATSCQVVWLLSWSRRRGDTSPWQPAPLVANRWAPPQTHRRGSCRSRCPAQRQRHKCNRSVRNPFWDNWDALCSSHSKSARSAKRIIQSLDSFTKEL